MRTFAFFAVLLITSSGGQLASALLPPFAVAAVEAMWARRMATSSTPAPFRMGNGSKSTAGKPSPPPPTSHTKATTRPEPEIPELMLRDILPQGGSRNDRSVQKNLMETLMEGKMILRGDTMKDEGVPPESTPATTRMEEKSKLLGVGGLGGLYPAVRKYAQCHYNGSNYEHGDKVNIGHPCDQCTCRSGKLSCFWKVCDGSPDFNCVPLFVPGNCCPIYTCNKNSDSVAADASV